MSQECNIGSSTAHKRLIELPKTGKHGNADLKGQATLQPKWLVYVLTCSRFRSGSDLYICISRLFLLNKSLLLQVTCESGRVLVHHVCLERLVMISVQVALLGSNVEVQCRHGGVMVSTDVAARGIDIPNVTHVVQADFAASAVDFLHRVGL